MLFSKKLIKGGVHPKGEKQLSNANDIVKLPTPKRLFISLKQHSGGPAKAIIKEGDRVTAGQLIAIGQGGSANIHAPQTGIIDKIANHIAAIPGGGQQAMIYLLCNP